MIGSESEIQFLSEAQDDPQKRKPDIRKAKLLLGWEPVVCTAVLLSLCAKTQGGVPCDKDIFQFSEYLLNAISRTVL